jgi:hypothetical protein
MAEVLPAPKVVGDQGLQGLLAAVRTVVDMVKAVEAEQPKLILGAQQLADAVDAAEGISVEEIGGGIYRTLVDRAADCAEAVAGQLEPARAAAERATKLVAATVPLPDGKQAALLARYWRDLERRLASEMAASWPFRTGRSWSPGARVYSASPFRSTWSVDLSPCHRCHR